MSWNNIIPANLIDVPANKPTIKSYINGILASFQTDPADSMYQAGYEACAKDVRREIDRLEDLNKDE